MLETSLSVSICVCFCRNMNNRKTTIIVVFTLVLQASLYLILHGNPPKNTSNPVKEAWWCLNWESLKLRGLKWQNLNLKDWKWKMVKLRRWVLYFGLKKMSFFVKWLSLTNIISYLLHFHGFYKCSLCL